jgi:hypothetical protein
MVPVERVRGKRLLTQSQPILAFLTIIAIILIGNFSMRVSRLGMCLVIKLGMCGGCLGMLSVSLLLLLLLLRQRLSLASCIHCHRSRLAMCTSRHFGMLAVRRCHDVVDVVVCLVGCRRSAGGAVGVCASQAYYHRFSCAGNKANEHVYLSTLRRRAASSASVHAP